LNKKISLEMLLHQYPTFASEKGKKSYQQKLPFTYYFPEINPFGQLYIKL
jgi:hypothetical protein